MIAKSKSDILLIFKIAKMKKIGNLNINSESILKNEELL
jgi:hypothetical protein